MSILYGSKIILPYGGVIEILQKDNSSFEVKLINEKVVYFNNIITLLNSSSLASSEESKFFPFVYAALVSKDKQIKYTESATNNEITYIAKSR